MIRSVLFKGTIRGNGVVNYDSKDQRWILRDRFPQERDYLSHDNVKIAKHTFYKTGEVDGKPVWERRLCISSDCLRQAVFGEDFPFQNTSIMHHQELLYRVIASIPALLRGYFFAEEGKPALKRKSPVMITAAEQTSSNATHFEIGTMSGAKRAKKDQDEASDTSMHYEEKVGEVTYAFEGALDLKDLQFVSLSETYDRMAVNPDHEDEYRRLLGKHLGSAVGPKRFYLMKGALIGTPEEGILLTQEQVAKVVSEFFKRLLRMRIQRSKSYAHMGAVEVKFVSDPVSDTFDDKGGWRTLKSEADLRLKPEDIEVLFEPMADEAAQSIFDAISKESDAKSERKKIEREAKQKAKSDGKKSARR